MRITELDILVNFSLTATTGSATLLCIQAAFSNEQIPFLNKVSPLAGDKLGGCPVG